jgi:hypothetical protein
VVFQLSPLAPQRSKAAAPTPSPPLPQQVTVQPIANIGFEALNNIRAAVLPVFRPQLATVPLDQRQAAPSSPAAEAHSPACP